MKEHFKGLGTVALLFFLILLNLGTYEAKQAFAEPIFSQSLAAHSDTQKAFSELINGIQFKDALHRQSTELTEIHHLIRRLPLISRLEFCLGQPNEKLDLAHSSEAHLNFCLTEDLTVSYRNFRI